MPSSPIYRDGTVVAGIGGPGQTIGLILIQTPPTASFVEVIPKSGSDQAENPDE